MQGDTEVAGGALAVERESGKNSSSLVRAQARLNVGNGEPPLSPAQPPG